MRKFIPIGLLAFLIFGCSLPQLQKAQDNVQAAHDATTKPIVVAVATATDPLTGGGSTAVLGLVGLVLSGGANILQAMINRQKDATIAALRPIIAQRLLQNKGQD